MADRARPREEDLDRALNPHLDEERAAAARETVDRLHGRGIEVSEREMPEDLGGLMAAVERFEEMVEMRGGDLMVDDLKSSAPDDPHFVVPRRRPGEPIPSWIKRIEDATIQLATHRSLEEPAEG
ncbi:MAG: hypothetical protein ACT4PM_05785 [Gemmatimonadales bacterium]